MHLNTLTPANGSKTQRKRVGRGIGSGTGKTCGRGHKGQHARSGGYHKVGFEGGQMPLQRRVPKFGFKSRKGQYVERLRLHELNHAKSENVTLQTLKSEGMISHKIKSVKVYLAGKIDKALQLSGISVTKGAREAIEAAGGKVIN